MTEVVAGAWVALAASLFARSAGLPIPPCIVVTIAAVTLAISLASSVRTLLGAWRGPVITSFPRADATLCDPPDADAIRGRAQLRGTMGGAGHVSPARLWLPAAAWASAAVVAAMVLRDPHLASAGPAWSIAALCAAAAAAGALVLPARPFFYREVTDGRVLVFPPEACSRLLRGAARATPARPADAVSGARTSAGGWVSSRNPVEARGNCPPSDQPQRP